MTVTELLLSIFFLSALPGYPGMPPMLAPPGDQQPICTWQVNPSMPGQVNPSMSAQVNPSMPGQVNNGMPRPMTMMAPGSSGPPTSGAAPPMYTQNMYQANPTGPDQRLVVLIVQMPVLNLRKLVINL